MSLIRRHISPSAAMTAVAFGASGALLALYPLLRPFSSERGLDGAQAFGSNRWVLAHSLGMAGFLLLALALFGFYIHVRGSRSEALGLWATVLSWIGIALVLPYYGAEAFGLHAIGESVSKSSDPAGMASLVDGVRWEAGVWFIIPGLLILAVALGLLAVAVWRSPELAAWGGFPLATAFALYIPQYMTPQPVRVAHGMLILAGCLLLAWQVVHADQKEDGTNLAASRPPNSTLAKAHRRGLGA